jgi:hypothetical protein
VTVRSAPRAPNEEQQTSVEELGRELEALMREARRRARRRRAAYATAVVAVIAGVVIAAAGIDGGGPNTSASIARGSPAPANLSNIQPNPKHPNIVYGSTLGDDTHEGGVWKSTDGGKTWILADKGLSNASSPTDSQDLRVDALALDPRSPDVLYAGTGLGVFKTIDAAKSWTLSSTGIEFGNDSLSHRMYEGFVYEIVIDPMHRSTIYATHGDRGPVWKSTDDGRTWHPVTR